MMRGFRPEELRLARLEKGLTLRDAAKVTGITKDTISLLERGKRRPFPSTLYKLAQGYGVSAREFLDPSPPAPLDVVGLTREVHREHPGVPTDSKEFRELVDERFIAELRDLTKPQLEGLEAQLRDKYNALDKSFHSPTWTDQRRHAEYLRLLDEIRAVKLAMDAVSRVKTAA